MYFIRDGLTVMSATSTNQVDWSIESSTRLQVGSIDALDGSSITSCGILIGTDTLRMYYVGISTIGRYSILSATSTNGTDWTKEPGIRFSTSAFIDTPRPLPFSSSLTHLFFIADRNGGNSPANFRVFLSSSADRGLTWSSPTMLMNDVAHHVSVTTMTDLSTRLYFSNNSVPGSTVTTRIHSARSTNGTAFTIESGQRISTATNVSLSHPVVIRSTESFRWRMFYNYTQAASTAPEAHHALTMTPVVASVSPDSALKNQTSVQFTITGEIFAPNPTASFTQGSSSITWFNITQVSDLSLTGFATPLNAALGLYTLTVTNPDSGFGTLPNAFTVELPPGEVSVLDNMFRPLKGGQASITFLIFEAGHVTLRLYTTSGALVATLLDEYRAAGSHSVLWNGRNAQGAHVASGLYLLKVTGPNLKSIEKIVVIK